MENQTADNGKTVALIAYLFFLGWIIALLLNNNNKTVFGSFHIRQSLGIMCTGVLVILSIDFFDIFILSIIAILAMFVFWLIGFLSAVKGEMKLVPFLGEKFQDWFKGI
jgi:uncharacterized membrane protein